MTTNEQTAATAAQGPGADTYFNASRVKVIGLILAGVLLVGALGGIAGAVFDPEPIQEREPAVAPVGPPGVGAGQSKASGPVIVGENGELTTAAPRGRGKFLRLSNGVVFWLPSGWRVDAASTTSAWIMSGKGSYAYIGTARVNPRAPASQVLRNHLRELLPSGNYTQLRISGPKSWAGAFGSVASSAYLEYLAMWVDNQGSTPIYGQMYGGVRRDGIAMVVLIEHIPPKGWNGAFPTLTNIVTNSFGAFGGVL